MVTDSLETFDRDLWQALENEKLRQEEHIELIASENYASKRVMRMQGTVFTNKYAEGYPGRRYYGGCENMDMAEQLAIDRVKKLFGADYANVQPHSGAQANAAAFMALMRPHDTLLGMNLSEGGHLTHGSKVNFSGRLYHAEQYGINSDGYLDYDQLRDMAHAHRPKVIIGGFSAYSRTIDWALMREIADEVDAYLLVDMAHIAGLVAAGLYPDPLPYAHVVTSTTHKTLRGPRGGIILMKGRQELEKKMNSAVFPGTQGGPLMHIIAAKAVAFAEALREKFNLYQAQVVRNAQAMANIIQERGYMVVSGGTDNHLMLISLIEQGLTGKEADAALGAARITVNKNAVPNDPQSPFVTSGIRLGTPACTTRGFKEKEAEQVASWICDILDDVRSEKKIQQVLARTKELCRRFPVYA